MQGQYRVLKPPNKKEKRTKEQYVQNFVMAAKGSANPVL
jgi:hypothetical protein